MNDPNPLVSVVLCTYNDEKYIRDSIQAVLCQSFVDFEFIIWNDGSTDSTESIINSFKDDRIRYFYHENTGLGAALALACKEARGKYIARIDGDDLCMPNRLEKEVAYLESFPNTVLVSSAVIYIDENNNHLGRSYPWTWNKCIKRKYCIVHPATMFRTDVYNRTCGYQGVKSAQDRLLWSKMASFGDFAIINEPLILYRWIPASLSHRIDINSPYAAILELIRKKMESDIDVSSIDISLHNDVYKLCRTNSENNFIRYQPKGDEKIAQLLKIIIGEKASLKIVTFLKNIYVLLKY